MSLDLIDILKHDLEKFDMKKKILENLIQMGFSTSSVQKFTQELALNALPATYCRETYLDLYQVSTLDSLIFVNGSTECDNKCTE